MQLWPPYGVAVKDQSKEYDRPELANAKFRDYFGTFFVETTLQGFPNIVKQPGILKKLLWVLAISLCGVGLYWELNVFITKLLEWNANTSVGIINQRMLHFPAVTLCNNNPVINNYKDVQRKQNTAAATSLNSQNIGTLGRRKRGLLDSLLPATSATATTTAGSGGLLGGLVGGLTGTLTDTVGSLTGSLANATGGLTGGLTDTLGGLTGSLTDTVGGLTDTLGGLTGDLTGTLTNTLGGLTNTLNGVVTGVTSSIDLSPATAMVEQDMQNMFYTQDDLSSTSYTDLNRLGHQLCDMVAGCRYNGIGCDTEKDFRVWHWNPLYGNCFTFNAGYLQSEKKSKSQNLWDQKLGDDGAGIRMSYRQGDMYGLYLLLNVDNERYFNTTSGVGWRVVIHGQTDMPFPEDGGVSIMPGTSTRIAVTMSRSERLGVVSNLVYSAKYSDCINSPKYDPNDKVNAYAQMMEVKYSASACSKTCYQRAVMKNCKCYDMDYPHKGPAFSEISDASKLPACLYKNQTNWKCKTATFTAYSTQQIACDCPDSCADTTYSQEVSMLKWPSIYSTEMICKQLYSIYSARVNQSDGNCSSTSYVAYDVLNTTDGSPTMRDLNSCIYYMNNTDPDNTQFRDKMYGMIAQETLNSRYAEVYIYYKSFNYQKIIETENIALEDLLAYMGGILGLFFGFSFMTLFEYVQLLIDVFCICCAKMCCRSSLKKPSSAAVSPTSQMLHTVHGTPMVPRAKSLSVSSNKPMLYLGSGKDLDSSLYYNNGQQNAAHPIRY